MTTFQPIDMVVHFPRLHTHLPFTNSTLLSLITPTSLHPPIYHTVRPSLIPSISDKYVSLAAPILAYWFLSFAFLLLDTAKLPYFEARRIHESPEVLSRNRATVRQVITAVMWQHVIQTALGLVWLEDDETILRREFYRDDLGNMAGLAPKVGAGVLLLLGNRTGEELLKSHGEALVRWVYWWGIPIFQMVFAL
jgi:sphinganine C4-monooxygenase